MPKPDDVGVGTAMLLINDDGQVLLGKRKGAHRAGFWSVPGGWLDRADADTVQAAIRETYEETGLEVTIAEPHIWLTEDHPEIECRTVTLYHTALCWKGEPHAMEPDKCEEWRWFPINALPTPLFPGVYQAVQEFMGALT